MIEIKPYKYRVRCDIYKCSNLAKYTIGNVGEPSNTRINLCEECLQGIIDAVPEEMLQKRVEKMLEKKLEELSKQAENTENEQKQGNGDELESKTVKELREMAKEKGIEGYTNMKKDELIKALM